jgi:hypothetical protein
MTPYGEDYSAKSRRQRARQRKDRRHVMMLARLLRRYTEMPGHPSFQDWRLLRDQAVLALALVDGIPLLPQKAGEKKP